MTTQPHHDQALLARESLVKRIELAGDMLLSTVPMAMSGLSDEVRAGYTAITAGAAVLHVTIGAGV
jgi:hypothetical protein